MFDRRRGAAVARTTEDAGVSLIELVVSMTIMTVVLAVFTGAAVQMFHSTNDTETIAAAQSQVNVTFLRLDKEIRYAVAISVPDASNVEYLRTDEGTAKCTRLWLNGSKELRSKWWYQQYPPPAALPLELPPPPDPVFLASNVSAVVFTRIVGAAPVYFQRLRLVLTVTADGRSGRSKTMDTTFTALNTSLTTSSDTTCTEGR
ncbi:MAG: hypothetical protein QOI74_3087 [Micromonosporaceae bacterium]|jgi:type II secretory pathway pseudopilin PulG|nr:hypothetical protein [Micromonosporaceae bacterium]